jgi:hypothetical protein
VTIDGHMHTAWLLSVEMHVHCSPSRIKGIARHESNIVINSTIAPSVALKTVASYWKRARTVFCWVGSCLA